MSIHPIFVVDRVIEEYKSHVLTEFRARDSKLRDELSLALEERGFLSQEPFFQAYRPFQEGMPWRELGLDPKLCDVMERNTGHTKAFLHQSQAIAYLLGSAAGNLAVTTGTGSGKTECFLLPVLQNAIDDAIHTKNRPGLTAILIYPMNALANDQEDRIQRYLERSGHSYLRVGRYDRSTSEEKRAEMRKEPPHLLLTNYMMLEYLLVRPADREAIFRNHRCRFLVLDEVHSYRGALGTNIALLFRRLRAHLGEAVSKDGGAYREPLVVGTSATIKGLDEVHRPAEEVKRLREEAVREFLGTLTGHARDSFLVLGEEMKPLSLPLEARVPEQPVDVELPGLGDEEGARRVVARLGGLTETAKMDEALGHAGILWVLHELLAAKPMSLSGLVDALMERVPERRGKDREAVEREVRAALYAAAGIGEREGALKLKAHRFLRGGFRFCRCVDESCGKLHARGEGECGACGKMTAPLLLCRSCGADALHLMGGEDPETRLFSAWGGLVEEAGVEWVMYRQPRPEEEEEEAEGGEEDSAEELGREPSMLQKPVRVKGRLSARGFFDPDKRQFQKSEAGGPRAVLLSPGRNRCLVCGYMAGSGSALRPVSLGTSAALRVLSEGVIEALEKQHRLKPVEQDSQKEKVLIFADSRQDAAHQARYISYAGRFDRMRRGLLAVLGPDGGGKPKAMRFEQALKALYDRGAERRDNKRLEEEWAQSRKVVPKAVQEKAKAWEEAPLLDDIAANAGYRATIFNLGLVGVRYENLETNLEEHGSGLAADLGLSGPQFFYLCRCLLDEIRTRGAFSRPALCAHPTHSSYPEGFGPEVEWERRVKTPQGFPCDKKGEPLGSMDASEVPEGVHLNNAWGRARGGRKPRLQRIFETLMQRMGQGRGSEEQMRAVLRMLMDVGVLCAAKVLGYRDAGKLLMVNADMVELVLLRPGDRMRCSHCNIKMPWVPVGMPCRACEGKMRPWPESELEENRYVRRLRSPDAVELLAGEHTAQVTSEQRQELEEEFKSDKMRLNVLACSPTLEMGIDVRGLDAVLMRNVPPRPDNYAQRGGRAGRASRTGVVLGYARSTPHDQYFYEKPAEMIAGAVAAPVLGLSNRDIVIRHMNAIAMGGMEPGLSGRMAHYVSFQGELQKEAIDELVCGFEAQLERAAGLALLAWGPEVLEPIGLNSKEALMEVLQQKPAQIRDVFDRVRKQVIELRKRTDPLYMEGARERQARDAFGLIRRLLGMRDEREGGRAEADDRGSGHPMRRLAEFGILPGYEFPSEPATLRLLRDRHEEEPIAVQRRFGLAQYQPGAVVHARGHRWKVIGLDMGSPWNPRDEDPAWNYRICGLCGLRCDGGRLDCPRCKSSKLGGQPLPSHAFGGFLARRDDAPVLEEEERIALANLLRCYPQWNGDVVARYELCTGWLMELRMAEEVQWLNEGKKPTKGEGKPLHSGAQGFCVCPSCGYMVASEQEEEEPVKRAKAKANKAPRKEKQDARGHAAGCDRYGQRAKALAIGAKTEATTLRIFVDLPVDFEVERYEQWGLSLGFSLRTGMRRVYMLDGSEIEFELEPMWEVDDDLGRRQRGSLTFLDPAVGGSGFLERAAAELHRVAAGAVEHLEHEGCEKACYRCLKSYQNQRFHSKLSWLEAMPALEMLRQSAPRGLPLKYDGTSQVKAWLEAYDAGVGSPLELKALRILEARGIQVEKQFPIALPGSEGKAITVADFAIPAMRVAMYVDGAAFHKGENLRRDRYIRERLSTADPPWRVIEIGARDIEEGLPSLLFDP